jgi:hypothetical protein
LDDYPSKRVFPRKSKPFLGFLKGKNFSKKTMIIEG